MTRKTWQSAHRQSSYRNLRKLQIEGVNLPGADVAGNQRNLAGRGREPGPGAGAELAAELPYFLQVGHFFEFRVADSQAKIPVIAFQHGVEINIGAVLRPGQVAKEVRGGVQLAPLFGLHVVEHQFVVPGGDRK